MSNRHGKMMFWVGLALMILMISLILGWGLDTGWGEVPEGRIFTAAPSEPERIIEVIPPRFQVEMVWKKTKGGFSEIWLVSDAETGCEYIWMATNVGTPPLELIPGTCQEVDDGLD